jgi:small-conductance mechanosensitive channel
MDSVWQMVFWGNTVQAYGFALGGIVLTWMAIRILRKYVLDLLEKYSQKTNNRVDDVVLCMVDNFVVPWVFIFIIYNIIQQLNLHPKADKILYGAFAFVTMYYAVRLVNNFIQLSISGYMRRRGETEDRIKHLHGLLVVVKVIVWVVGLLTLANNFGFNVSTLLASLGIGGVAIALASQAILGDLFGYLVIFFDKPFEIGDFVILGPDVMGTVEYIGIKTTRIRSLSGEQLIISNTNMTNSTIRNYKRMERRRVVFKLSVPYKTPLKKVQMVPGMVADIVKAQENIQFDRSHLLEYGEYSINFEIVYYLLTDDFNKFMDTQQTILYSIRETFDKHGIEFAYPTQNLFVDVLNRKENGANGEKRIVEWQEKDAFKP